jgi:hypothetical protein
MQLITVLNHYQHFPGFVYAKARLCRDQGTIEIDVPPRRGSKPVCSHCHRPERGYDRFGVRRIEFGAPWGFAVPLLYQVRRVDCRACGGPRGFRFRNAARVLLHRYFRDPARSVSVSSGTPKPHLVRRTG